MSEWLLGLRAETCIHPGSGRPGGLVDRMVAREEESGHPFIAASSLTGALARVGGTFRVEDPVRLLLLPVRCLSGPWRWITCPRILERLPGIHGDPGELPEIPPGQYLGRAPYTLFLEERCFVKARELTEEGWIGALEALLGDGAARLRERLTILHDRDFAWFAGDALPLGERRTADTGRQVVEEFLPPDTLMYARLEAEEDPQPCPYLRLGGNRGIGEGWFHAVWERLS